MNIQNMSKYIYDIKYKIIYLIATNSLNKLYKSHNADFKNHS